MQCPKCNRNNPDDATQCANCAAELPTGPLQPAQQMPQQPYAPASPRPVPNYVVWSVINIVLAPFLCNPATLVLGIIAVVKAASANKKRAQADYQGAAGDANVAMILNTVGSALLVVGLVFAVPFWAGLLYGLSSFPGYHPRF